MINYIHFPKNNDNLVLGLEQINCISIHFNGKCYLNLWTSPVTNGVMEPIQFVTWASTVHCAVCTKCEIFNNLLGFRWMAKKRRHWSLVCFEIYRKDRKITQTCNPNKSQCGATRHDWCTAMDQLMEIWTHLLPHHGYGALGARHMSLGYPHRNICRWVFFCIWRVQTNECVLWIFPQGWICFLFCSAHLYVVG